MNTLQNTSYVINRGALFDILKALFVTRAMYSKLFGNAEYARGFDDGFKSALAAVAESIGANERR